MPRGVGAKFIGFIIFAAIMLSIAVIGVRVIETIRALEQPPRATPALCEFKSYYDPDYGCEIIAAPGCGALYRLNAAGKPLVCRGPREVARNG